MIRLCMGLALFLASPVWAECRQALAVGLDVSGSVDSREYRIQLDGMAGALLHPEVQDALLAMSEHPVRLNVFEWSGPGLQRQLTGWVEIRSADDIASAAATIRNAARIQGDPSTAIGAAMAYAQALLAPQSTCWQRTLDLSGDGKSNSGPRPQDRRGALEAEGITINGLVIETAGETAQSDDLPAYYQAYVIAGAGAFVEQAAGFSDFEAAMVRKLKRELQGQLFSQLTPDQ